MYICHIFISLSSVDGLLGHSYSRAIANNAGCYKHGYSSISVAEQSPLTRCAGVTAESYDSTIFNVLRNFHSGGCIFFNTPEETFSCSLSPEAVF